MRQARLGSRGTGDGIGMIRIGKETLGWLGWEHETQARSFVQTTTSIPINWPRIGLDWMGWDWMGLKESSYSQSDNYERGSDLGRKRFQIIRSWGVCHAKAVHRGLSLQLLSIDDDSGSVKSSDIGQGGKSGVVWAWLGLRRALILGGVIAGFSRCIPPKLKMPRQPPHQRNEPVGPSGSRIHLRNGNIEPNHDDPTTASQRHMKITHRRYRTPSSPRHNNLRCETMNTVAEDQGFDSTSLTSGQNTILRDLSEDANDEYITCEEWKQESKALDV
ncbi:hypothetical protein BJ165DRAFT_1401418 [Panaeolus papilionaceus]|nr:hypothetical protein BJ165DRAFT_1401418 [Panaeolus papilionaceus]